MLDYIPVPAEFIGLPRCPERAEDRILTVKLIMAMEECQAIAGRPILSGDIKPFLAEPQRFLGGDVFSKPE